MSTNKTSVKDFFSDLGKFCLMLGVVFGILYAGKIIFEKENQVIVAPIIVEVPNESTFDDIIETDATPEPEQSLKEFVLYENHIFSDKMTHESILNASKIIKLNGKIEEGLLRVKASASSPPDEHAIYFYVQDGENGGLLGAKRKDEYRNHLESGFFVSGEGYDKEFNLSPSKGNAIFVDNYHLGQKPIDLLEKLNSNEPFYIGSVMNSGRNATLDFMSIQYKCVSECKITELKEFK